MDAASTSCYLLKLAERRNANTWGYHLLYAVDLELALNRMIALMVLCSQAAG